MTEKDLKKKDIFQMQEPPVHDSSEEHPKTAQPINWQKAGAICTAILSFLTLFMVIYTAKLAHSAAVSAKSATDQTNYIAEMAKTTAETSANAARMAQSNIVIGKTIAEMAESVKKMLNPVLTIYFVVESDFPCTTEDGICFDAEKYFWKLKKVNFFLVVKNEWSGNIDGELKNIRFIVSVFSEDWEFDKSNKEDPYVKNCDIELVPLESSKKIELDDFEKYLEELYKWGEVSMRKKRIKIIIERGKINVPKYSSRVVDVRYLTISEYNNLFQINKDKKNRR